MELGAQVPNTEAGAEQRRGGLGCCGNQGVRVIVIVSTVALGRVCDQYQPLVFDQGGA